MEQLEYFTGCLLTRLDDESFDSPFPEKPGNRNGSQEWSNPKYSAGCPIELTGLR